MSSYTYIYQGPNTTPINKYHKWYIDIIHNRQTNVPDMVKIPCENHHIIPDSLDGNNDASNMVYLTLREHFVVHVLLTKFLQGPAKYKMLKALDWFNNSGKQYCNSRLYEVSRLEAKKFKSYMNIDTEEYLWFKEDPGEGWIQQGTSSGMTFWYNESTDTYTTAKESPGDDWIQQGPSIGMTSWYNESTDTYTSSKEDPGEGWIQQGPSIGMTFWYNESTDTYAMSKESPGDEWIRQGINKGMTSWYNESTDTYTNAKESPGDDWIRQGINKGATSWYNESIDVYTMSKESPGEEWVKQCSNKGRKYWYNESTGVYKSSKVSPGDGWIKQGTNKGMTSWYNESTDTYTRSKECPGDGWIHKSHNEGERNSQFKGYYCHNKHGKFPSAREMGVVIGISEPTMLRIFKKLDTPIINSSYKRNKYLKSLTFNSTGMTWRELGFYFISANDKILSAK